MGHSKASFSSVHVDESHFFFGLRESIDHDLCFVMKLVIVLPNLSCAECTEALSSKMLIRFLFLATVVMVLALCEGCSNTCIVLCVSYI